MREAWFMTAVRFEEIWDDRVPLTGLRLLALDGWLAGDWLAGGLAGWLAGRPAGWLAQASLLQPIGSPRPQSFLALRA